MANILFLRGCESSQVHLAQLLVVFLNGNSLSKCLPALPNRALLTTIG